MQDNIDAKVNDMWNNLLQGGVQNSFLVPGGITFPQTTLQPSHSDVNPSGNSIADLVKEAKERTDPHILYKIARYILDTEGL